MSKNDELDMGEFNSATKLLMMMFEQAKSMDLPEMAVAQICVAHATYYQSMLIDTQNKVLIQSAIINAEVRDELGKIAQILGNRINDDIN